MRMLALVVLALSCPALPARAEEPHTLRDKTVEGWLAILRDAARPEARRREAVEMLGGFGPEAMVAAPDLIAAAREGPLRTVAVDALVNIGAGSDVTVPILIDRLVKRGSQHLTGQGTFFYDASVDRALARVGGPAVLALVKILDGPDRDMAVCAAKALADIGPAARAAVPSLIRAVERRDPGPDGVNDLLATYATRALGRIGPKARAAIPALRHRLERMEGMDPDAVVALHLIGAPPAKLLLDAFLRDGDPNVANLLAELGPTAREAAPALRKALTNGSLQSRVSAAVALAHLDPSADDALPVLIDGLKHWGDQDVDTSSVPVALAQLGPRARPALPALIRLVESEKESLDTCVVGALVRIDPEGRQCVPALIQALRSADYDVVDVTATCLSLLGPQARAAIPVLRETLTREFAESFANGYNPHTSAAKALRRVDPEGKASIPALTHALFYHRVTPGQPGEDVDWEVAEVSARILGSYGEKARSAIPVLIDVIRSRKKGDGRESVRQAAALALGQMGPDARKAIPVIRDYLEELRKYPLAQAEAVAALYRLAPDGREIAERWRTSVQGHRSGLEFELRRLTVVLGAMGRTSFETDRLVLTELERLDEYLGHFHRTDGDPRDRSEWLFERIGEHGAAGRLAIPRLKEFRTSANPLARMWAAEALERITAPTTRGDHP
jgi:HEAT repeat protein